MPNRVWGLRSRGCQAWPCPFSQEEASRMFWKHFTSVLRLLGIPEALFCSALTSSVSISASDPGSCELLFWTVPVFPFIFVLQLTCSWRRKPLLCSGRYPQGIRAFRSLGAVFSEAQRILLLVCVIAKGRQVSLETSYAGLSWQPRCQMTLPPQQQMRSECGWGLNCRKLGRLLHILRSLTGTMSHGHGGGDTS